MRDECSVPRYFESLFILNSAAPVESANLSLSPILPGASVRLAFLFQFASELSSRTPCLACPRTRQEEQFGVRILNHADDIVVKCQFARPFLTTVPLS